MTETETHPSNPRFTLAAVLFVLLAPALVCGTLGFHFLTYSMEQIALTSGSLEKLAWAGPLGLGFQAVTLGILTGMLWFFTKDRRYRPVYAGWLGAALMSFPALILRALGPNNDQIGSLAQIFLTLAGAGIVLFIRRGKITWNPGAIPAGLIVAAAGIAPLAVYGAFGSPADLLLNLLAGLSFGLLAAALIPFSTENVLLDALGIGTLLALLGSALGYDGSQLILLGILPPFAFAIAALVPSTAAAALTIGLLAGAGLACFDPTELTIVLSDIGQLAFKAALITFGLGWLTGALALIVRQLLKKREKPPQWSRLAVAGMIAAWAGLTILYLLAGHRGFYGDRLFVILKDQADISSITVIPDREKRLEQAYSRLTEHANTTQAGLRKSLERFGIRYTPYYLVNGLEVQGGTLVRLYLMTRPEVERVIPSPRLRPAPEAAIGAGDVSSVEENPGWNIRMIGADKVWEEFGVKGRGIVIGQSDSGVDGTHPALRDQYRGAKTGGDYNWFDPWEGTSAPNDENGHGTHTLGTILGAGGIGVAPEATWIGCVNLNRNLGNPALYLDCLQFMLAPFPHGGDPFKDGDPARAAHVLNNSWGCPPLEGCDAEALKAAADNLRAAGIFVVASTGNDGPNCETINTPLALYDSVFSVGAVDQSGNLADFSSRGPVTVDGSGRMKPDISAPGVEIFSSLPDGTYGRNSGTSMAGPHLVGVVALMWAANPALIGDIDQTEKILIETAAPYTGQTSTGCFTGGSAYGHGVVDAYAAVKKALGK